MPESTDHNPNLAHRRGFIVASLLLAGLVASGGLAQSPAKPPRILFVCQAGTAKSAIAREILRRRAAERRIAVEVVSRGLVVTDHVSPELRARLSADGIDTTTEPAMPLESSDWAAADVLVNFNPLPASVDHKDVRDWTDVPSVNDDYINARAVMDKRIDELLTEIANRK
jgi:protein-tyrosine-phosphatase